MENSFKSVIDSSRSVLILLPTKPYFDQVAGGLALLLAMLPEKQVSISCPSPMTVEFNRLVGVNKIKGEVGNKNLSLRFNDYQADNIERVSYDIENGEFRLTVIPKPGLEAPKKEQVSFSYSGLSADTIVLVGGLNEKHFPALESKDSLGIKLVHMGTKELSLTGENKPLSFVRPASSVSEIVGSLIKESGLEIGADIATNLLMGIEEGSNGFKSGQMNAETFEMIAYLMRKGGQRKPIVSDNFPPGSIPGKIEEKGKDLSTPKDWVGPKIYKGTDLS